MRPDKKWLYKYRILIMVCLSILCAFTIEIFVYQWNVLNNPQQHLELSVKEQEKKRRNVLNFLTSSKKSARKKGGK